MVRPADGTRKRRQDPPSLRALKVLIAVLAIAVILVGGYIVFQRGTLADALEEATESAAGGADETVTSTSEPTGISAIPGTSSTLALLNRPPPPGQRWIVPPAESEPEAKQLAVDIAYALTTYDQDAAHGERLASLGSNQSLEELTTASTPLIYPGLWSRGEVIYPQMGGLTEDRVSVMVVIRQTVGSGSETESSVVRTLDIRLQRGESGWKFDSLASAGGSFESTEDLAAAHALADDPRIVMPDSARLDIISGLVSPKLLEVMTDLAEQTPYEVVVLATGHPPNVFETDRVSHHTVGQAVDINRIGERLVVEDRDQNSTTRRIVEWLYDHPDVLQIGSPWDLDGSDSRRSFSDAVHQDHVHLAVDE